MSDKIPAIRALLDLTGRTALVTGASGGIGAGIARRFAEAGAGVICHYHRNQEAADRLVNAIAKAGGRAVALQANMADSTGAARLMEKAADAFGTLDILINSAGLQGSKPMAKISEGDWTAMMAANVAGPFFLIRALAERLRSVGRGGAVVNISSIEGYHPAPGHGHYATAKAALLMLTRAAAVEFAPLGLRVNCVCPGLIHREGIETGWPEGVRRWTKAAALKRLGSPEDVADACLFLASDAARWITGADLKVDGGVTAGSLW